MKAYIKHGGKFIYEYKTYLSLNLNLTGFSTRLGICSRFPLKIIEKQNKIILDLDKSLALNLGLVGILNIWV